MISSGMIPPLWDSITTGRVPLSRKDEASAGHPFVDNDPNVEMGPATNSGRERRRRVRSKKDVGGQNTARKIEQDVSTKRGVPEWRLTREETI